MNKAGKILLYLFSCLPLLWTATILLASLTLNWRGLYDLGGSLLIYNKAFIVKILPIFYFILTPIYSALMTYLKVKQKISTRIFIINITLTLIGILAAYLSLQFDIFCVSGCYID